MTTRRDFLVTGAALAAAALPAVRRALADEPGETTAGKPLDKPAVALRLSCQLGVMPGKDLAEKLGKMQRWGFDAVEVHGDAVGKGKEFVDAIAKTNLKYSAICWGSHGGDLVSEDKAKRQPAADALKQALDTAAELKALGVVYVPAFNGQTKLTNQEIRPLLVDALREIGEYAAKLGTHVILEPLNRGEAFFLRQVADGAMIVKDIGSPGVAVMGDFYHMGIEEPSDFAAFVAAGPRLKHVHLGGGRQRLIPGQDDRRFVDGFRGLKFMGYEHYCSFECGVRGDRDVEIPKSMEFLRQQWAEA